MRYYDTSSLISLLVPDTHTGEAIVEAKRDEGQLSSSVWASVEVKSALAKEIRIGNLTTPQALAAWTQYGRWLAPGGGLFLYAVERDTFETAGDAILIHPERVRNLRAGDAVHIAAAQKNAASGFVTADRGQADAARDLGLEVTLLKAS